MGDTMDIKVVVDKIDDGDITACALLWVLLCLYIQIGITFIAVVRTTVLNYSVFLLALTAFFLSIMILIQNIFLPKITLHIIDEKV